MAKILFIQIPAAVEQALIEQLRDLSEWEILTLPKPSVDPSLMPDLVIASITDVAPVFPGCPVLPIRGTKPLRLGTLLRQIAQMLAQPVLYIDDINIGSHTFKPQEKSLVRSSGESIALTDREVDILAYLARRAGRPVSREDLLKNVWQYQDGVDTHTLETHVYRLRQKIEQHAEEPHILLTTEGGYSLHLPEVAA
ncbi:MAG: winged helix-turn-helix domain-containing protein [Proteobacteria bacterium]|nr:winged helix-turn-helix domain-containing protein [Pseudomonadota bacterium]